MPVGKKWDMIVLLRAFSNVGSNASANGTVAIDLVPAFRPSSASRSMTAIPAA